MSATADRSARAIQRSLFMAAMVIRGFSWASRERGREKSRVLREKPRRLYSWVRFEPKMGTLLAPLRGFRPGFFALAELSASLAPVYRFYLGRGDDVLPRRRARKRGDAATNPFAN